RRQTGGRARPEARRHEGTSRCDGARKGEARSRAPRREGAGAAQTRAEERGDRELEGARRTPPRLAGGEERRGRAEEARREDRTGGDTSQEVRRPRASRDKPPRKTTRSS